MAVTINGSTGITNVDGSAGAPAEKGTTSSTAGVFFPAANTVAVSTASTEALRVDSSQNVGVGTTSPGSKLDVKGTLRLSGSSSGYVGLAPAAAAGSTTYVLPSADGTSGQMLSTNGSGTLSWATAGGVTSVVAGNGISVSGTTTVTVSQDIYTGTTTNNTSLPIGSYITYYRGSAGGGIGSLPNLYTSYVPRAYSNSGSTPFTYWGNDTSGTAMTGTWRYRGPTGTLTDGSNNYDFLLLQRTA